MRRLAALTVGAVLVVAGCDDDPYPWPRPGDPSATVLENELRRRDSLQDAANDLIAVTAEMRAAVQRVYATRWSPVTSGGQLGCDPPFVFLHGSVYEPPEYDGSPPESAADRAAAVAAVADVLRAHHAEKVEVKPAESVSGTLPGEHGYLHFVIGTPAAAPSRPFMTIKGRTGCHLTAPGPGPWDTPLTPTPTR